MARSLTPACLRSDGHRRVLVALVAAGSLALVPLPASAEPAADTSAEVADVIAARAHDLEVLTEEFNQAREELRTTQAEAAAAAADQEAADAALLEARDQVRVVAVGAY